MLHARGCLLSRPYRDGKSTGRLIDDAIRMHRAACMCMRRDRCAHVRVRARRASFASVRGVRRRGRSLVVALRSRPWRERGRIRLWNSINYKRNYDRPADGPASRQVLVDPGRKLFSSFAPAERLGARGIGATSSSGAEHTAAGHRPARVTIDPTPTTRN